MILQMTSQSDGTGETDVRKIVRGDLQNSLGDTPAKIAVEKVKYNVSDGNVEIKWDTTPKETVCTLEPGAGETTEGCFEYMGGLSPSESGGTGDIMIDSSASYNIELCIRLK
jgi:hypothetical protein